MEPCPRCLGESSHYEQGKFESYPEWLECELCPRCHGEGGHDVQSEFELYPEWVECELCHGIGLMPAGTHDEIPF